MFILFYEFIKQKVCSFPIPSKPNTFETKISSSAQTFFLWISPRPISNIQLHTLLYFHPCPIYLVVYKGSYWQARDISS